VKIHAQRRRPTLEELEEFQRRQRLIDDRRMADRAGIEAQVTEGLAVHERWRTTRSMTSSTAASQNPPREPAHDLTEEEEEDGITYDDESVEPLYEETPTPVPAWMARERYPYARPDGWEEDNPHRDMSCGMNSGIRSWPTNFSRPVDREELVLNGYRVLTIEQAMRDKVLKAKGIHVFRTKLSPSYAEALQLSHPKGSIKRPYMYASRAHAGGDMFCYGLNSQGRKLVEGGSEEATAILRNLTAGITKRLIRARLLDKHQEGPLAETPKSAGHLLLDSQYFATMCGSFNMTNVGHKDEKDEEPTTIAWNAYGDPKRLPELYFLLEVPGDEPPVAIQIENGTGIRFPAMKCWHRSVLVGAELDKVTLPDGTFNRLALKLAMKDLWLKEKTGWAGFAWVVRATGAERGPVKPPRAAPAKQGKGRESARMSQRRA